MEQGLLIGVIMFKDYFLAIMWNGLFNSTIRQHCWSVFLDLQQFNHQLDIKLVHKLRMHWMNILWVSYIFFVFIVILYFQVDSAYTCHYDKRSPESTVQWGEPIGTIFGLIVLIFGVVVLSLVLIVFFFKEIPFLIRSVFARGNGYTTFMNNAYTPS